MRTLKTALAFALVLAFAASAWADGVTISMVATDAPNGWGSPSFGSACLANDGSWISNAFIAAENGWTSYGNPSLPTYYSVAPSVMPLADNVVTGFPSWMGVANPAVPFASELGNRVSFVAVIKGNGTMFNVANLSFTMASSDAGNTLGYSWGAGQWWYDPGDVGIIYGKDGPSAVNEYTYVTNDPTGTTMVDEYISVGAGNAWDIYADDGGGVTLQQKLNTFAEGTWYNSDLGDGSDNNPPGVPTYLGPDVLFTGTFTLGDVSGSASVDLVAVPEPISMIFFGTGLVAVGGYVSRRRMLRKAYAMKGDAHDSR